MCPKPSPRCVSIKLFYFTTESRIFQEPTPHPFGSPWANPPKKHPSCRCICFPPCCWASQSKAG